MVHGLAPTFNDTSPTDAALDSSQHGPNPCFGVLEDIVDFRFLLLLLQHRHDQTDSVLCSAAEATPVPPPKKTETRRPR